MSFYLVGRLMEKMLLIGFYCVLHGRLAVQCICFLSHCIASKHPGGVGAIA